MLLKIVPDKVKLIILIPFYSKIIDFPSILHFSCHINIKKYFHIVIVHANSDSLETVF